MDLFSKSTLLLNTFSSNQDVTIQIFLCASKFSFCDFLLTNSVENKSQRLSSSTTNSSHKILQTEKYNSNHVPQCPTTFPCSLEHHQKRRRAIGILWNEQSFHPRHSQRLRRCLCHSHACVAHLCVIHADHQMVLLLL